jgi:hypothetical protein
LRESGRIADPEAVGLFLHATRCGLFEMSWDVLCPQSGMVLESFGALRTLKTHYECGLCDVTGDTDLDDFIKVSFTVSPRIRRLPFHDPDQLSVEDFHWKLRFAPDGRLPGQQLRFLDVLRSFVRGVTLLPSSSTTRLRVELSPGALSVSTFRHRRRSCCRWPESGRRSRRGFASNMTGNVSRRR